MIQHVVEIKAYKVKQSMLLNPPAVPERFQTLRQGSHYLKTPKNSPPQLQAKRFQGTRRGVAFVPERPAFANNSSVRPVPCLRGSSLPLESTGALRSATRLFKSLEENEWLFYNHVSSILAHSFWTQVFCLLMQMHTDFDCFPCSSRYRCWGRNLLRRMYRSP